MKIVGLITEYNPFHNGHLYHIHESLRITGADAALVVMSGDYVQRGTVAVFSSFSASSLHRLVRSTTACAFNASNS